MEIDYHYLSRNAPTDRICVRMLIIGEVVSAYRLASEQERSEPELTVSYLAAYVSQCAAYERMAHRYTKRQLAGMVRGTVDAMARNGRLERSRCNGRYRGEAWGYAPTATTETGVMS